METNRRHIDWLEERIREARIIAPGATMRDMLAVFRPDGGLQRIPPRRFVLRSCSCIKVDIELEASAAGKCERDPDAKLLAVSKPYLELEHTG